MSKNTATAFSKFVLGKTSNVEIDKRFYTGESERKYIGVSLDSDFKQYRAVAANFGLSSKWKVLYEDTIYSNDEDVFECRFLTVDGNPLRCKPDLVLESINDYSDDKRKIIIVEKKTRTSKRFYPVVPDLSWANVRAQLWCYSWISDWDYLSSSNVILITEYFWCSEVGYDPVYMGCRGAWKRSDRGLNEEMWKYFKRYGGKVDERMIYQLKQELA